MPAPCAPACWHPQVVAASRSCSACGCRALWRHGRCKCLHQSQTQMVSCGVLDHQECSQWCIPRQKAFKLQVPQKAAPAPTQLGTSPQIQERVWGKLLGIPFPPTCGGGGLAALDPQGAPDGRLYVRLLAVVARRLHCVHLVRHDLHAHVRTCVISVTAGAARAMPGPSWLAHTSASQSTAGQISHTRNGRSDSRTH